MEFFEQLWNTISPYFADVSISALVGTGFLFITNSLLKKFQNKLNIEDIFTKVTDKGLQQLKEVSFKQSIQPLVESGLQKINEKSIAFLESTLSKVQSKYDDILLVLEKMSAVYDNSIGVPESVRQDIHTAIDNAKTMPNSIEGVVGKQEPLITPIVENTPHFEAETIKEEVAKEVVKIVEPQKVIQAKETTKIVR